MHIHEMNLMLWATRFNLISLFCFFFCLKTMLLNIDCLMLMIQNFPFSFITKFLFLFFTSKSWLIIYEYKDYLKFFCLFLKWNLKYFILSDIFKIVIVILIFFFVRPSKGITHENVRIETSSVRRSSALSLLRGVFHTNISVRLFFSTIFKLKKRQKYWCMSCYVCHLKCTNEKQSLEVLLFCTFYICCSVNSKHFFFVLSFISIWRIRF